jgi:hypothetical protein
MRNKIKKILKEEETNKVLKNYIIKLLERQVEAGLTPQLDIIDLERKGFLIYMDKIKEWYREFVGGDEEAFKLFKRTLEGKIVTDKDFRKITINVAPQDNYEISIIEIHNPDYRGKRIVGTNMEELEFSYGIIDGQFETNEGIMTLDEIYDDISGDLVVDVFESLAYEIEDYMMVMTANFGLDFDFVKSYST